MYRNAAFGDVPDTLRADNFFESGTSGTFSKVDPSLTYYNSYYQLVDGQLFFEIRPSPEGWELVVNETINPEDGLISLGTFECLITDFAVTNSGLFDNFGGGYSISFPNGTGTVFRQSLCFWRGVDSNGNSIRLIYSDGNQRWEVYYINTDGIVVPTSKDGFQNEPNGNYSGGQVVVGF